MKMESIGLKMLLFFCALILVFILILKIKENYENTRVYIYGVDHGLERAVFDVEVVESFIEKANGLSNIDFIDANKGMLFVYENPADRSFWMKNMRFPIDIIWLKNEHIIGVSKNAKVPEIGALDKELASYNSPGPADMALEINAGLVEKLGILLGDQIKIE